MENRESESELNECKKKLNKAHQTIEELKIKMTQDKKNHKWEIREINKRIEQATDKNLELYDRESKALIYADQLEKDKNILVKEKREHEKKIEKLERENVCVLFLRFLQQSEFTLECVKLPDRK